MAHRSRPVGFLVQRFPGARRQEEPGLSRTRARPEAMAPVDREAVAAIDREAVVPVDRAGGEEAKQCRSNCERQDSNLHGLPHWILNPARLPIPPLSQGIQSISIPLRISSGASGESVPFPGPAGRSCRAQQSLQPAGRLNHLRTVTTGSTGMTGGLCPAESTGSRRGLPLQQPGSSIDRHRPVRDNPLRCGIRRHV